MIKKELYKKRKDGIELFRSYSTEGLKIKQIETGLIYDEAIDIENSSFNYEETNERIDI